MRDAKKMMDTPVTEGEVGLARFEKSKSVIELRKSVTLFSLMRIDGRVLSGLFRIPVGNSCEHLIDISAHFFLYARFLPRRVRSLLM